MRTKIVHGIDDNVHIDEWIARNNDLPDSDPYKLSIDEFCGRWLALELYYITHDISFKNGNICSGDYIDDCDNFQPCMNCLYYGEFKIVDSSTTNAFGRWEPPIIECHKLCANCVSEPINEQLDSVISDDSSPDSVS